MAVTHPGQVRFHNGGKAALPFEAMEYDDRLQGLRDIIEMHGLDAVVLTSAQNMAYYSGLLHGGEGLRGCVVTLADCVVIGAQSDGGWPWRRSFGDAICHAGGPADFWRAVVTVAGEGRAVGCEADHLTLTQAEALNGVLRPKRGMDISAATMQQRMVKSPAEIALIRQAAAVADLGAEAIRDGVRAGAGEWQVAMVGRDAMEREIAARFPEAEYGGTRAWVRSGLNSDGAHAPLTGRRLQRGDILSMSLCPVISGYGVALGRTLFLGAVDAASLAVWQAGVDCRDHGLTLLRPGASCAGVADAMDGLLAERGMALFRRAGVGKPQACEAALDLRAADDTVLEPGMVVSLAPMLTVPDGQPGAGGYCMQDTVVIADGGAEALAACPSGPAGNVIG